MNRYLTAWGTNSNYQLEIPYSVGGKASINNNLVSGLSYLNAQNISLGYDHGIVEYTSTNGYNYLFAWGGDNVFGERDLKYNFYYKNFDAGINTSYAVDKNGIIHGYGADLIFSDVSLNTGEIINWPFINRVSSLYIDNGGLPQPFSKYVNNIDSVSAGSGYLIALTVDGKITGWGNSGNPVISGKKYTGINALGFVTGISAGYRHALALLSDGTITGWGDNSLNQLNFSTGLISGVKVSTKSNTNLFMGLYNPLIKRINTGFYNINSTGWRINYQNTGVKITGIIIQTSLDKTGWSDDLKTGQYLYTGNILSGTGAGYPLLSNNYYVRLIQLANSGQAITGGISIFNPITNISKLSSDYKIYNPSILDIKKNWAENKSWYIFKDFESTIQYSGDFSRIIFSDDGKKQLLYKTLAIFHSVDLGNSWNDKANTIFNNTPSFYVSGAYLSWSPNGNTLNASFDKNYPDYGIGGYLNEYNSETVVFFDTNINNTNKFSYLILQPISYCLDEAQKSASNQIDWIRDYLYSANTFEFKNSHASNNYTVLIGNGGAYSYNQWVDYLSSTTAIELNSSGRLYLLENWKTGIYTGYDVNSDIKTGDVYSLEGRMGFPLYQCPGGYSCSWPDPFFERTATLKGTGYYTGNNSSGSLYWNIAKITDKKNVYGIVENASIGKNLASISFNTGLFLNLISVPAESRVETGVYKNTFSGNSLNIYRNNKNWIDMDISEDGQYQTAIANTGLSGYIYITANSGNTWKEVGLYSGNFTKVKISTNGEFQIVLKQTGSNIKDIYSSADYGNTWYANNFYDDWTDIAVSNKGLQGVISKTGLYYNTFEYMNKDFLKVKDNNIVDISAGYNSNLILTEKPLSTGVSKVIDTIDYNDIYELSLDKSTTMVENSWYSGCDGFYYYYNIYNGKPSYLSTGTFAGTPENNAIRWYDNRWNVYTDRSILIYYSREDTFYPWQVNSWSGLTTGSTGTFEKFNPGYFRNTGYTGGSFGYISKYEPLIPPGVVIECNGYIYDT